MRVVKKIFFTFFLYFFNSGKLIKRQNKLQNLESKVFKDLSTPLPFLNFLLKNPFSDKALFKNISEIRKLEQNPLIANQSDSVDINHLVQTSDIFRIIEDKSEIQECRIMTKNRFIPKPEKNNILQNDVDLLPLEIRNSCKNIKKSCCSKDDFLFLKNQINPILSFHKKNFSFLKKIIKTFRDISKEKLVDYVSDNINKFRSCNARITSEKFIQDFMHLKSNIHTIETEYVKYMENRIKETLNLNCGFCDFKNINYFRSIPKNNLFYLRIKVPNEIKFYYKTIKEFEKFIPLIAFSNMIECLDKIDFNKDINSRNMDFKYIKTGIMEKLDIFLIDQIINNPEIIDFFEKNYVPGVFEAPLFQNIFLRIILLKNNYEDELNDKIGFIVNDKIFSKTFYGLHTLNEEILVLKPKNVVFRYSDEGYSNGSYEFKDRKYLKEEIENFNNYKGSGTEILKFFLVLFLIF